MAKKISKHCKHVPCNTLRDRPFNLKGGRGYGFLFRSEKKILTTQELEYLFFLSCKARIFFPEFNHRRLCRVKNMLAMYLKYHKAGLTLVLIIKP